MGPQSLFNTIGKDAVSLIKFNGKREDYSEWKIAFLSMAKALKVANAFVVESLPTGHLRFPLVDYYGDQDREKLWDLEKAQAFMLLLTSQASAHGRRKVTQAENNPKKAWDLLEKRFNPTAQEFRRNNKEEFYSANLGSNESPSEFLERLIALASKNNEALKTDDGVVNTSHKDYLGSEDIMSKAIKVIKQIGKYNVVGTVLDSSLRKGTLTMDDLEEEFLLLSEESSINVPNATGLYGNANNRSNKDRPRGVCWNCHEEGHIARQCPKRDKSSGGGTASKSSKSDASKKDGQSRIIVLACSGV
jgi:Zinc knuckle